MRKTVVLLLFPAVLFGGYLAFYPRSERSALLAEHARVTISVTKIDPVARDLPGTKEINYFETEKDIGNWVAKYGEHRGIRRQRSDRMATQGLYSMRVEWNATRTAELVLFHFPEDWEKYGSFACDVLNPGPQEISFELRIGDYFDTSHCNPRESRFIVKTVLKQGVNRLRFGIQDIARKINVDSPRKIIHVRSYTPGTVFYLDNMRLERKP